MVIILLVASLLSTRVVDLCAMNHYQISNNNYEIAQTFIKNVKMVFPGSLVSNPVFEAFCAVDYEVQFTELDESVRQKISDMIIRNSGLISIVNSNLESLLKTFENFDMNEDQLRAIFIQVIEELNGRFKRLDKNQKEEYSLGQLINEYKKICRNHDIIVTTKMVCLSIFLCLMVAILQKIV